MTSTANTTLRANRRPAAAFTLVELLTVMAIIAVLLAVSLPALKGLNGSGNRKSAVGTLMGVLDQARMLAISDGRATYVVFAGRNLVESTQLSSSMIGKAYAVFEDSREFVPVQRSSWQFLPTGISFKISDNGGVTTSLMNRPPSLDTSTNTPDPIFAISQGNSGSSFRAQLPFIKFDSTGAPDLQEANYLRVLLFEGAVDVSGKETVLRNTGGAGLEAQRRSIEEIRINPVTGRARYITDSAQNLAPSA